MSWVDRVTIKAVRMGSAGAAQKLGMIESGSPKGLGALRGEAIAALTEALSHWRPRVRSEAAWALEAFQDGTAAAVPSLVRLLKDSSPDVRSQAAGTLGRIGATAQFLPELIEALGAAEAPVREGAADALGGLGSAAHAAVPALTAALGDPDRSVRLSAATALGEIGRDAAPAVPTLFRLVLTEDTVAQASLVESVMMICERSDSAADTLRTLLAASGDQLRGSAAVGLKRAAGLG